MMDNRIIGLRCSGGPLGFPGFGRGLRIPSLISSGWSPVAAILLSRFAVSS